LEDFERLKDRRILLLNPPGDKLYLRDYYCSKISKANYVYQPTDLLILSGILAQRHEVHVLDAIVRRLSFKEALNTAEKIAPDVVIFLTGAVSKETDFEFLSQLSLRLNARFIGTGDILLENPRRHLEELPWLDAIIMDFTADEVLAYLQGATGPFDSLYHKEDEMGLSPSWRKCHGQFLIPIPRHELFLDGHYRHPFVRQRPMATVLTDYGCPFDCRFCVMPSLGYKYRPVDNVMAELRYLASLGIREVYFNDQTFGVNKDRALSLCQAIAEERLGFGWVCFSRVDLVDEQLLDAMKGAGCHTIAFGVESGSEEIRTSYRKEITREQILRAFEMCRGFGFDIAATFIMGLPEETEEDLQSTLRFAIELKCDFASFNVAVPRMRTELRQEAISSALISPEMTKMDQSGTYAVMGTRYLSREEIERMVARAIRRFYCRPSYVLSRARRITSLQDLRRHIVSGLAVLRDVIRR